MKTVLVEFVGLPGSGKSTITNYILEGLGEKGYSVTSDNDIYDNGFIIKLLRISGAFLDPHNFRFNISLMSLLMMTFNIRRMRTWIGRYFKLVKLNGNIRRLLNQVDYIVLSEGYLQVFSSMFDEKALTSSIANRFIDILHINRWSVIEIKTTVETASKRIIERKENDDEWYFLDDRKRTEYLLNRETSVCIFEGCLKPIIVDGNVEPKESASVVIQKLGNIYEPKSNN